MYVFKYLNLGKLHLKNSFPNSYIKGVYDSEHVHTATK